MTRLQPLIILIMKSLPKIKYQYLNFINENENFYAIVPIEIKRQLWIYNNG